MYAIGLNRVGNVHEVFVDHWHKGTVMLGGEVAEDFIEGHDVISSVVGGKSDSREQYLDLSAIKRCENRVQIATCLVWGYPAETVVAAKFHDHNGGMKLENRAEVGNGILAGGTAGAAIRYRVMVAKLVEIPLQSIGKGLAGCESVASRDAVAVANDESAVRREEGAGEETEAKRNDNPAGNVHIDSVRA
jgi:hypothetical protein